MKACDATTIYYRPYKDIIGQLRCPVCDGQRIDSSNAAFAQSVKRDVCKYLVQGVAKEEVIAKVEADYGQSLKIQSFNDVATLPITMILIILIISVSILLCCRKHR